MNKLGSTEKRYDLIIREIRKLRGSKELLILEVGAGSKIVENFLPLNCTYHTMDNAEGFWKEKYTYSHNLDNGKFPIQNSIDDVVICNETLEHVMYPEKAIGEIMRVSKKDSILFLSLLNEYNFVMRFYYVIGKKTKVDEPFHVVEKSLHIHKPRVKDILSLFSKYFRIDKVDYVQQSRNSEKSRVAETVDRFINFLAKRSPNLFSRTVVVKCSKIG